MKLIDDIRDFIATDAPIYDEDILSDCCGAQINFTDICSDCKEHCCANVTCEKCNGQGIKKVFFMTRTCKNCKGEGYVEYDLY